MTYKELKENWTGKVLDYDGQWGGQCWDLAQYYFVKCLGLPSGILGGCGYVNNMLKEPKISLLLKYFDEVDVHQMLEGDVCIWETSPHIALFDSWDGSNCWYFSQNPNPCNVIKINNLGSFRVFRLKSSETTPEKESKEEVTNFKVGDKVVPIKLVNYKGVPLVQYDDEYIIVKIDERGATLSAQRLNGLEVWAVLSLDNIKLK